MRRSNYVAFGSSLIGDSMSPSTTVLYIFTLITQIPGLKELQKLPNNLNKDDSS